MTPAVRRQLLEEGSRAAAVVEVITDVAQHEMNPQEGPPGIGAAAPPNRTADHQTDPHHHDQALVDPTGVEGQSERDDPERELRAYLHTCCGDAHGWLHIGVGYEPFINGQGRYCHRDFAPKAYCWPSDADVAVRFILAESMGADVWVCPNLMRDEWIWTEDGKRRTGRAKGQAVSRLTVHSDIDTEPFDPAKAEKLAAVGGFAITSGTPGNAHVYVSLSAPVSVDQHQVLCVALGEYIGGADPGKHSDNDLLRPPGTFNHKPTVFHGQPPAPVRWLS